MAIALQRRCRVVVLLAASAVALVCFAGVRSSYRRFQTDARRDMGADAPQRPIITVSAHISLNVTDSSLMPQHSRDSQTDKSAVGAISRDSLVRPVNGYGRVPIYNPLSARGDGGAAADDYETALDTEFPERLHDDVWLGKAPGCRLNDSETARLRARRNNTLSRTGLCEWCRSRVRAHRQPNEPFVALLWRGMPFHFEDPQLWKEGPAIAIASIAATLNTTVASLRWMEPLKEALRIRLPPGFVPDNDQFNSNDTSLQPLCTGLFGRPLLYTRNYKLLPRADIVVFENPAFVSVLHKWIGDRVLSILDVGVLPTQLSVLAYPDECIDLYPVIATDEFLGRFNVSVGYRRGFFDVFRAMRYHEMFSTLVSYRAVAPFLFDDAAARAVDAPGPVAAVDERNAGTANDVDGAGVPGKNGRKFGLVVAMISNCVTKTSPRDRYLGELMQHVRVDSYGKCRHNADVDGDIIAKHSASGRGDVWKAIKRDVFSRYPFAVAFENAHCYDYVTEKAIDALASGTIPLYMGAPNAADFLPPGSFIDVRQYSPRGLAAFLRRVVSDRALFESFHAWRSADPATWTAQKEVRTSDGNNYCEMLSRYANAGAVEGASACECG